MPPTSSDYEYRSSAAPGPLRSAMKHSSRPPTPQISPSSSPFITRIPLPTPGSSPPSAPHTSTSSGGGLHPEKNPFFTSPPGSSSSTSPGPCPTTLLSPSPTPTIHVPHTHSHNGAPSHLHPILLAPNGHPAHSSPAPPTPGYTSKVSFDTFENQSASMFSFTLQVKSEHYRRTRSTRVFLCAASPDESGREALDWALEALVQDGDELIVCRGVDEDVLEKDHNIVRDEARELMRSIQAKSVEYDSDRKLSIILEYIPGRITDTLDRLIALYRPDSVVVGTRGKRTMMGLGLAGKSLTGGTGIGSVSKYCLTHSPVPIIVVRPERKVRKAVEKRRADPKRGRHFESA